MWNIVYRYHAAVEQPGCIRGGYRLHPPSKRAETGAYSAQTDFGGIAMRFALIATGAAAIAALPAIAAVSGPQMDAPHFLSAVRCAAYESVAAPRSQEIAALRYELNTEAQRQDPQTAAQARSEAASIAREATAIANAGDTIILGSDLAPDCSGASAQVAHNAGAPGAA